MSGQQWGSVIGGVIGSFIPVVGTALGSAIGGMIGGAIDPTKVYGPRLTDAQTQTAMDGVIRAYGDGTFPCKGNLIWQDIVKEHKHTDDGKGSGQEQITYTYTRSYAIGVCKGPISGYKIIKRNGKIVFDARTDAELSALGYSSQQIAESRAAQAKFRKVCTLYYGDTEQMPDPTMVAVEGVGNVPAYRGTAYIVLTDDETMQGEVAQYEFVVANCGDRTEDDGGAILLVSGSASTSGGPVIAEALATETPEFEGIDQATGADLSLAVPGFADGVWVLTGIASCRYSVDNRQTWQTSSIPIPTATVSKLAGSENGWIGAVSNRLVAGTKLVRAPFVPDEFEPYTFTQTIPPDGPVTVDYLSMVRYTGGNYYADRDGQLMRSSYLADEWEVIGGYRPDDIVLFFDVIEFNGEIYVTVQQHAGTGGNQPRFQIRKWDEDDEEFVILLDVSSAGPIPWQLESGNNVLIAYCWGGSYLYTSANGFSAAIPTGIQSATAVSIPAENKGRQLAFGNGRFYLISGHSSDPAKADKCVTTVDGLSVSSPISLPIASAQGIVSGFSHEAIGSHPIPDAPGYFINPQTGEITGPAGTQITVCEPTLGSIVSKQEAKRIPLSTIDVSELTDLVTGFRVASPSSPQKNVQALQPGYFFDVSEFDGVMHHPKRGGEDSFALTVDDLCQRDGDLIEWERTQESELLRKLTVAYLDPDTTYTATTQQWERRSGTVKAEGEGTIELPIVGSKDWAARVAHKSGKVAWAEPDKCKFSTSIAQAKLVTAAVGTITDEAGTVHRVRIERIEDEGLLRMVEARRTRADVYESTVSGVSKPLPLFPGSDIRGPTDGLLLNLPVIVDSNDVPGIAWAASGLLSGWRGGTLQFLRAGQWVDAGTVTLPATMGTLLSALPAHAGDIDNTNVLSLRMNEALESVTFTNLLQERNALAIVYPDGTAEIVQFQTATEVAAGEYELTTLIRGRLNTVRGAHAVGARVVFLDNSVQYAALQPTDVGTTLTYRFVSLGTDPDAAPVLTMDLDTMQSQTEWPVDSLAVEKDGDDFTLTWLARDRLGTDVFPIRSTNWRGYQVSWSYGDQTGAQIVLTETATFNIPGASDITFSVSQVNLYTGPGPAQTVNIP